MFKHLFFLILLLSSSALFSSEQGIEVRILQSIVTAAPCQVVTVQVEVVNKSPKNKILVGHLNLPQLWESIPSNDLLLHLESGRQQQQTIMIKPPEAVAPGIYPIAYDVWDRDHSCVMDRDTGSVVIGETCSSAPVSIAVTSAPVLEADGGDLLFITALVRNHVDTPFEDRVRLTAPEGWQCAPSNLLDVSLSGGEEQMLIYGLKVPLDALHGQHLLMIQCDGYTDSKKSTLVLVRPKIAITGSVDGVCEEYNINQMIQLFVRYENNGNVPINARLVTCTDPPCQLECSHEPFVIAPYESIEIPIMVSPEECDHDLVQFLLVKLVNMETGEQLYQNPMTLKLVAQQRRINDPYVRIPAYITSMVMRDRYKTIFAVETAGGGVIDPVKGRELDFFFRIPTDARHVIYNIDERLYVGMRDPDWDLVLGDAVYELSPLTQRYRYGRGAGVQHFWQQLAAGIHYTQNTLKSECDPHELCSYVSYSPTENFDVAINYLRNVQKHAPTANIFTFLADLEYPYNVFTEVEYGKSFVSKKGDNSAYRFESHGTLFKDTWFSLEKVYAGPRFYGYYNDIHFLSASLDFPIRNCLRLNINTNRFHQNFSLCNDDDWVVPKNNQVIANLTWSPYACCSFGLNGMLLSGKDLGREQQYNFYQKWAGFSLFCCARGFNFNALVSAGQQKDHLTGRTTHGLQRYYAYLCKDFTPWLRGSLFYESGNINYYDARPWRNGVGGSLGYRFAPRGYFDIFVQKVRHTADMLDLSQITANVNYTFKNLHKVQAMAQIYRYRHHYPNDNVFIVSYSVPFNLPVGRRQDIGALEGFVYNPLDSSPVEGALLQCGPDRATTNADGRFAFAFVPAGELHPNLERLPDNFVPLQRGQMTVHVPGGKKKQISVPVVSACSIRGKVTLFGYADLISHLISEEAELELLPLGGLAGVSVVIASEGEEEILSAVTNPKGEFAFPKLRPGTWWIRLSKDVLPPLHELDINDLVIEVKPKEQRQVEFHVLPMAPQIYKIEN